MFSEEINFKLEDKIVSESFDGIVSFAKEDNSPFQPFTAEPSDILVQEGDIAKNIYVFTDGIAILRKTAKHQTKNCFPYIVDDFHTQSNIAVPHRCWTGNERAIYNLEAVIKVTGYLISKDDWDIAVQQNPKLDFYFDIVSQFMIYRSRHQKDVFLHNLMLRI